MNPTRSLIFSMLLIICLGTAIYSNTFLCPFQFDDLSSIIDNSFIKDIHNMQHIWDFLPRRFILYYSLALNYHFNGLHVFGYHLFNLTVHLISALLVWWLTLLTTDNPLIALFAGLIFVSHPVQTEAVTYIVQRAASMATMFYVASLCFYIKSKKIASSPSAPRNDTSYFHLNNTFYYISSLLCAILAMFTKEIAITLPLMILLYEYCFLKAERNISWKRLAPFLLTLFIIPLTMYFTESVKAQLMRGVAHEDPSGISTWHYLLTQFRVMATYIRLLFLPLNQNLDYDYPLSQSIFEWPTLISLLFLISILVGAKQLFPEYRMLSFSIFWFFLTLLPESSLKPIKDVIAEHRLYLPMVGYSMFLAGGAYYMFRHNSEIYNRHSERSEESLKELILLRSFASLRMTKIPLRMTVFFLIVVALYSIMTYQRNAVWKDELTLLNDTILKSPHKERPYNNRGLVYSNQGRIPEAVADFTEAIEINPQYTNAWINRGFMHYRQGDYTQAISDDTKAIGTNPDLAIAYINRGNAYLKQNNFTQTIADYNKAIELKANYADVFYNLGFIYYRQGNFAQAAADFNKVLEINPYDTEALNNRNASLYKLEKHP